MDKNLILQLEAANDGRSVFLFYDDMAGLYLAFGQSAYYATMVTDPYMSYSKLMNMPVALLRREHILNLRQSMRKVEHRPQDFYRFEMKHAVGKVGYEKWEQRIRLAHDK